MTTFEKLERIRVLTQQIRTKQAEYKAMLPVMRPMTMDGMPHGGISVDTLDKLVDARDEMAGRIGNMCEELVRIQCEIKPLVDALPEHLHTFVMCYYYDNNDIENVAVIMGKAKSTLYEYKRQLKEM